MAERLLHVEVVYALPQRCWRVALSLPQGATVADALAAARREPGIADAPIEPDRLAVFAKPVGPGTPLRDGDRIEILRPLLCDPKEVRRQRARRGEG